MGDTEQGLAPQQGLVESALAALLPKGINLRTHVFSPLLDSADLGPSHWNEMLDAIDAAPDVPVLITHGTDTMAYSGAALSQALFGLDRSVVLCGSMLPLGKGGDAEANLALAVDAVQRNNNGVWLAFGNALLPARGLIKRDSHAHDSFVAVPQTDLQIPKKRRFDTRRTAILTLTPGLNARTLRSMLSDIDVAVLRLYGAGTATSDPEVLDVVSEAIKSGKHIRAVSQCQTGGLEQGAYAAGAGLWATGVQDGGLQTPEEALVYLWLN